MSVTTKTGDKGMSSYFEKRVSKDGKILEAVGTLDELQAVIQMISYKKLDQVVDDLYLIMGKKLTKEKIEYLDEGIKKLEKELKVQNKFVIFTKEKALKLNWVRTIVRRAERKSLVFKDKNILVYLNRLSDFIYLLALKEEE